MLFLTNKSFEKLLSFMVVIMLVTNKASERKKQILLTAMRLFSTKGYHQTSMQEIAEACKMSKGSLYVHFKSKEELHLNIFYYFSQMLEDNIVLLAQERSLTDRERFEKQLIVILNLVIEYREFLLLQFREFTQQGNAEFHTFLQDKTNQMLEWMGQRIVDLYGTTIAPHAIDLSLLINGMLSSYMRFFFNKEQPFTPDQLIQYILTKLDLLVNGIITSKSEALIQAETWASFSNLAWLTEEKTVHPLMLVKEIRELLDQTELEEELEEEMLQSIQILEQELIEFVPRRAIISGMLHNLSRVARIRPLLDKLSALL